MFFNLLRLTILYIILLLIGCNTENESNIYSLKGEWEYRPGFDTDWLYLENYDPKDWKKINLPTNLTKKLELKNYTGYLTLRKTSPDGINEIMGTGKPIAINAGRVLDVSYFYFNSTLIGQLGSASPYKPGAMRPFLKDIPVKDFKPDETNTITIVLYGNTTYPLQFMDAIEIGESSEVYSKYTRNELFAFFFLTVYLVIGLNHIFLYLKRPKDKFNLYFGLFSFITSVYWFTANTFTRDAVFGDHVLLHRKLEHILLFMTSPLLMVFLVQFFERRFNFVSMVLSGFCAILVFLTLIGPLNLMRICSTLWQSIMVFVSAYMVYYVAVKIKNGYKEAIYLLAGLIILMFSVLLDMAGSSGFIPFFQSTNFAFFVFVVGITSIMANRFASVTNEVEVLNAELEQKVEDRTKKLQLTLDEVQKLKIQQDGDYFLTSLLLKPLSTHITEKKLSNELFAETIIKQKKKFKFKNKNSEIGGDICILDTIELERKKYSLFLNADAMGKSIQGAGGCLVFGSVIKSIIKRNSMKLETRDIPPEIWLYECYNELQNVFISFDGSMLISAIMGLIEPESGTTYYINAEHPFLILFRDEKASFLDTETYMQKIGVDSGLEFQGIKVIKLESGDSILCGSDGKDDILIDDGKQKIVNENESLILKFIEDAHCNLAGIEKLILTKGEFIDDFSMLKITYNKKTNYQNSPSALAILKEADNFYMQQNTVSAYTKYLSALTGVRDYKLVLEKAENFIEKRDYRFASLFLSTYIELNPSDSGGIYLASFAKKKNKEYVEAAKLGERYKLRDKNNVKNLVNLADIYRMLNLPNKSMNLLTRALELEPDNKHALKLKESMQTEMGELK